MKTEKEEYICRLFRTVLSFKHNEYFVSMGFRGHVQAIDVFMFKAKPIEGVAQFLFYVDILDNTQILKIVNYIEHVLSNMCLMSLKKNLVLKK